MQDGPRILLLREIDEIIACNRLQLLKRNNQQFKYRCVTAYCTVVPTFNALSPCDVHCASCSYPLGNGLQVRRYMWDAKPLDAIPLNCHATSLRFN